MIFGYNAPQLIPANITQLAARVELLFMTHRPVNRFPSQTATRWGVRLVFAALCVVVVFLSISFVRMAWREHEINQIIAQQTALNEAQRERNAALNAEATYRESDAYAELAAREQLGMAREGETVLLPTMVTPPLAQPSPQADAQAVPSASNTEPQPNYRRWWHALFPPSDDRP
jgi:cell division protein FtsB